MNIELRILRTYVEVPWVSEMSGPIEPLRVPKDILQFRHTFQWEEPTEWKDVPIVEKPE